MPNVDYLILLGNLGLGILVGCYGTLVGAGGGFLLVPLFLLVHHLPHETAVGTSLAIVMANAFSGTVGYIKDKKIDYRAGVVFALFTFPGAILGGLLTDKVSGPVFNRVFGVLLSLVALYLLLRRPSTGHPPVLGRTGWGWRERRVVTKNGTEHYEYFEPLGCFFSLFVGMISSWFGIGGGIIHVPMMTEALLIPVHVAVATSHFILGFTALAGVIVHLFQGHVNFTLALTAGAGAILGAQIGVKISRKAKGSVILRALSIALLAVGLRLIFS